MEGRSAQQPGEITSGGPGEEPGEDDDDDEADEIKLLEYAVFSHINKRAAKEMRDTKEADVINLMSPKMNQLKKLAFEEMAAEMYIPPSSPMKTICASKKKWKIFWFCRNSRLKVLA